MLVTKVAIIGGGPSGLAAALTFRRYTSHSVVVIERGSYEEPRVGETVSSAIAPLLDYLGAGACLRGSGAIESCANAAAWGSEELVVRDHMFTGRGNGWHLDRRRFDLSMAGAAEEAGAMMLRSARIRSAKPYDDKGWILSVEGERRERICAAQVIDASGRGASFARLAGATRESFDHLAGVVAYFTGLPENATNHGTLVEAEEHGWWYAALLPNAHAVVAIMADAHRVKDLGVNEWATFYRRLQETRHVSRFLADAEPIPQLHIHPASSQRLDPLLGTGWIAVGDAAASYDPLSSLGIGHALNSGIQGARIVDARLGGDEEFASTYPGDVARFVEEFQARKAAIYQAERRWPDSEFWKSRQVAPRR